MLWSVWFQVWGALKISWWEDYFNQRGLLVMPDKNHDGNNLAYHLCRIDTKKGKILGEENFKKDDEAWTICGIAKSWRNLELKT